MAADLAAFYSDLGDENRAPVTFTSPKSRLTSCAVRFGQRGVAQWPALSHSAPHIDGVSEFSSKY